MALPERIRETIAEVRSRARSDANALDRATFDQRQALRAAAQRAQQASERAASGAQRALDRADPVAESPAGVEQPDVADRARAAGEARAPMPTSLVMSGDPRTIESMATAGGGEGAVSEPDRPMTDFVTGGSRDRVDDDRVPWFGGDDAMAGADMDDGPGWFGNDTEMAEGERADAFETWFGGGR